MRDLTKYIEESYKDSLDEGFGLWIHNGLWGSYDGLTFSEQKELFFLTLKKLLDDDLVVLFHPDSPLNMTQKDMKKWIWDKPNEDVVQYIRDIFPQDVKDENDDKLTNFWYGFAPYNLSTACPRIGWINQDTGEIVAS